MTNGGWFFVGVKVRRGKSIWTIIRTGEEAQQNDDDQTKARKRRRNVDSRVYGADGHYPGRSRRAERLAAETRQRVVSRSPRGYREYAAANGPVERSQHAHATYAHSAGKADWKEYSTGPRYFGLTASHIRRRKGAPPSSAPFLSWDSSVLRHRWVDLVGPGENASGKIFDVLEARVLQDQRRLLAACAGAAVDDDLAILLRG
jgi:hypothetical protein